MKTLYTAHATATGGRNGHAQTDDKNLVVELASPGAPNAKSGTTNPEQLFAAGYAACFGSALEAVAKKMQVDASGASVTAHVSLMQEDTGGYRIGVELEVAMAGVDSETVQKVLEGAHQMCPYSKATRGNIDVALKVAG